MVITGFNTDIEHDGVVYHVQTEDKGLDSPLILSLVYAGGAILASKRSRYEDLIAAGFDEEVLTERLRRQHRLICAAINAGRLEDLKRMGASAERESAAVDTTESASPVTQSVEANEVGELPPTQDVAETDEAVVETSAVADTSRISEAPVEDERTLPGDDRPAEESPYTVYDPRRQPPIEEEVGPG